MSDKQDSAQPFTDAATLRQRAEAQVRSIASPALSVHTPEEIQQMLHELRVHQIELEMQNEELRTAQAAIEAGRARYVDLYDLAPVGYCTISEKGLILETNLTAATLLGTTRSTLVKQLISRFILKEDQDIYYLHRKQLFATGTAQECDLRLVKSDGTFFWAQFKSTVALADDGTPVCRVTFSDITERKQMENQLKESEESFKSLMQQSPFVVELYDLNGLQISVNKAYEELWDFPAETTLNKFNVLESKEVEETGLLDYVKRAYAGDSLVVPEYIFDPSGDTEAKGAGRRRWLNTRIYPLKDESGKVKSIVIVHQDVTERKWAQLALEQKNEEIEQLVYSVSHDLKSPLVTVRTYAGMLRQDLLNADQQQITEDLNYIDKAANKMQQLLDALMKYSRIGTVDVPAQTLSADQQVQNCLATLAGILQQHQVQVSTGDLPHHLHGDRLHFGQIWQNLIENAVKYRGDQPQPHIEIGATQEGHDVVFYVRDNGMGIAPEHNERIFNLFSQLNPGSDGSGLGLALVKKIVTIYQGRIWVESDGKGKGSCFYFTLPGALVKEDTLI